MAWTTLVCGHELWCHSSNEFVFCVRCRSFCDVDQKASLPQPGPAIVSPDKESVAKKPVWNCCCCTDEVVPKDRAFVPCGHVVCTSCMNKWLYKYRKKVCPTCRHPL